MASDEAQAQPASEPVSDIRPLVAAPQSNRAVWIFIGVLAVAGAGLFSALEARRSAISSPATAVPAASTTAMIAPPPELAIPPAYENYGEAQFAPPPAFATVPVANPVAMPRSVTQRSAPSYAGPSPAYPAGPPAMAPAQPPAPAFAYRAPSQPSPGPLKEGGDGAAGGSGKERVQASRFINPSTTVPQGTVIQAVLETALDSNRAGFARAVVSRDVMSFDGSRVLIPRGSRLFGEYKSDLAAGQNRAMIQWHRLTRPDGGIVDVDSPSADPLGRAGVKGKVNSHFFARFGGAILQSALDIGTGIATRSVSGDNYYIGFPNAMQGMVQQQKPEQVKPTLTVKQGSGVSVFVARDLDFTAVEP